MNPELQTLDRGELLALEQELVHFIDWLPGTGWNIDTIYRHLLDAQAQLQQVRDELQMRPYEYKYGADF